MGILFRNSNYVKFVRLGKRTVKDGEALAVWNEHGVHTEHVGPQLVRLWMSTIRFLDRHVAGADEYLIVTDVNGAVEHVKGPKAMFCNPTRHKKIEVKKAVVLASPNECLVVYTKKKSTDAPYAVPSPRPNPSGNVPEITKAAETESKDEEPSITAAAASIATATAASNETPDEQNQPRELLRRIVAGPAIFVPRIDEWAHKFSWTNLKSKRPEMFTVLQTGTRRFDTEVSLRTSDSVLLSAELSIQFRVASVEDVIEAGDDPIAVMQSLLSADLSEYGTLIRSDDMLNSESRTKITVALGNMDTYKKLVAGAFHMGLEITGLCLKCLNSSPELQRQYDLAIQTKAELASKRAVAEQKQQLVDLDLANQKRRMESEQALASAQLAHRLKMKDDEQKLQSEHQRNANEEVLGFLRELKNNDVDLTQYLVSFSGQKSTIGHLTKANALSHLAVPSVRKLSR